MISFLSGLALVLLTLVGYSSGSVLGAKGRAVVPNILDFLVVIALWIAALVTRDTLGRWSSIAIWMALGLFLGMILARIRADGYQEAQPGGQCLYPLQRHAHLRLQGGSLHSGAR